MEAWYLIRDIDAISEQLKILQDNNVTVLWRPLHEASGGWFWWGCRGKDAYQWLWNLMYERQTHYHKLNNLIWVWNGQDPDWYVGDDRCDIIGEDVYADARNYDAQAMRFMNRGGRVPEQDGGPDRKRGDDRSGPDGAGRGILVLVQHLGIRFYHKRKRNDHRYLYGKTDDLQGVSERAGRHRDELPISLR